MPATASLVGEEKHTGDADNNHFTSFLWEALTDGVEWMPSDRLLLGLLTGVLYNE
jgi:hypothetical protein